MSAGGKVFFLIVCQNTEMKEDRHVQMPEISPTISEAALTVGLDINSWQQGLGKKKLGGESSYKRCALSVCFFEKSRKLQVLSLSQLFAQKSLLALCMSIFCMLVLTSSVCQALYCHIEVYYTNCAIGERKKGRGRGKNR